jgi:RNA polymerase sigma-32 factor
MHHDLEKYLAEVNRYPLLKPEEEQALARTFRETGDRRAAHALVTANLRFVVKVAAGYRGYGLRLADLIQEGNLGLMRAVEKFDPDQGIRLISYAVWWIRAYIQGHILQSWSIVKLGTTQAQRRLFFALARTRRECERLGADDADDADETVARRLRVRADEVRDVSRRMEGRDLSLDAPDPDGSQTHLDRVASSAPPQDEQLAAAQEHARTRLGVAGALAVLDERERAIVEQRIMADDPATLQDIGARFGFSRERARQIEIRARGKLRVALRPLAVEEEPEEHGLLAVG